MATVVPDSADSAPSPTPTHVYPRRVRVAEGVYQRIDRSTGKPVEGKFEFTYRDATGRQVWQTANGTTRVAAKAERAETFARLRRGERVERTNMSVGDVAQLWLERGAGVRGPWSESTRRTYGEMVRRTIESSPDPYSAGSEDHLLHAGLRTGRDVGHDHGNELQWDGQPGASRRAR